MPKRTWSTKDERQYKHIVKSCSVSPVTSKCSPCAAKRLARCKRIAAATVNATRRREGRIHGKA